MQAWVRQCNDQGITRQYSNCAMPALLAIKDIDTMSEPCSSSALVSWFRPLCVAVQHGTDAELLIDGMHEGSGDCLHACMQRVSSSAHEAVKVGQFSREGPIQSSQQLDSGHGLSPPGRAMTGRPSTTRTCIGPNTVEMLP